MSHIKERDEKTCLNCNAHIYGRYCHICGQENIEEQQSFWHLIAHFVYDVTHFDGKFFSTVKYLLFKPGFLSKEFLRGRRASYLDPVRMYVFTSAIFFLIYFSFINKGSLINDANVSPEKTDSAIAVLQKQINTEDDSEEKKILLQNLSNLQKKTHAKITVDTSEHKGIVQITKDSSDNDSNDKSIFSMFKHFPKTVAAYDSAQDKRPPGKKDGWFKYKFKERIITLDSARRANREAFNNELSEKFQHAIPQMMFVSLPFAALILQLLYIRRRKKFFYVDHGVFLIHVYIAFYILILVYNLFGGLHHLSGWKIFSWLDTFTVLFLIFYFYKAMHNFYAQKRFKTVMKVLLFSFLYLFVFVMIMLSAFIISVLQV